MKLKFIGIAATLGAILLGTASCIKVNEELGENFIPTEQIWNVYPCGPYVLEDITMERSDSLSGYSTSRFTFGSIKSDKFTSMNSTSFTLVPLVDSLDFGENTEVLQFHFTAVRDTVSVLYDYERKMLQNVYVHPLKKPLDSTILYSGTFYKEDILDDFVDLSRTITEGTPVYNGGDSLSFDFSKEFAIEMMDGINRWQALDDDLRDSLQYYLEEVPGIYLRTREPISEGGRINMFDLPIEAADGYLDGNYAELKIRAEYDGVQKDTLFIFYFGPYEFLADDATSYPTQYAFNASVNLAPDNFLEDWKAGNKENIYVEGGSGYKPVVKAAEIKSIIHDVITKTPDVDADKVVINKATIILPFEVNGDWDELNRYPYMLSPTVRLHSDNGQYVSYAGLTDSSIESENQGEINRSTCMYCPDISHHVQEIVKLKQGVGEDVDPNETDEQFQERLSKYDIWFLVMSEEITTESSSSSSTYDDYYNNLLYNSYYNNMMYDPYGYGYGYGGYGYGGYGYGGYGGYGYNNYYNYLMMAQYSSSSSGSSTSSSIELDKDRFFNAVLSGPGAGAADDIDRKPRLKFTFSAPKKAEE